MVFKNYINYGRKIQYNEKSWNNTQYWASFQRKKEAPDSKLYQVRYFLCPYENWMQTIGIFAGTPSGMPANVPGFSYGLKTPCCGAR